MTPLLEHLALMARHNAWAYGRLLDAVAAVPEADYRRDMGLFFRSIHGTLNHLRVGEQLLWFERFAAGRSPALALDAEVESDREHLADALRAGAARWIDWLPTVPPARCDGTIDYTTTRGETVSLPWTGTLAHVFVHSTHHRGQITAALTALGHPCPVLDLVYFLRAEQAGATS